MVLGLSKETTCDYVVLCADGPQNDPGAYRREILEFTGGPKLGAVSFEFVSQAPLWKGLGLLNSKVRKSSVGLPLLYYAIYKKWLRRAHARAKNLVENNQVIAIHLLTQITVRHPGEFYNLGVPFVWGPTGGTARLPASFVVSLHGALFVQECIRYLLHWVFTDAKKIKRVASKAKAIFVFSRQDQQFFEEAGLTSKFLPDAGCSVAPGAVVPHEYKGGDTLRLLWVGQLIGRKCPDLVLRALSSLEPRYRSRVELTIVGSGPMERICKELAESLGLTDIVEIVGSVSSARVTQYYQQSHLMVHTSYREACTHVIPEAMSTGLPVVAHRCCGMAELLKDCGFLINLSSYSESVKGFASVITNIIDQPDLI
ncbi:glycosyltransferase family 4 protein, partial [Luminiphilus sp.]|nr:glycosyltransferase family 4 protein [Luminiphilus sp.]